MRLQIMSVVLEVGDEPFLRLAGRKEPYDRTVVFW
jgi:hypothetical protein